MIRLFHILSVEGKFCNFAGDMENNADISLRYKDEADRAYGAAGMTVAVVVCNAEDILEAVDIDAADPADMIELTADYYMAGSMARSVRAAWQQTLSAYRASLVMAAGNLLARHLVALGEPVSPALRDMLREAVEPDGLDTCQLEADEIDELFTSTYSYLHRVFSNHTVGRMTDDFAALLRRERRLGHADILQALRALRQL